MILSDKLEFVEPSLTATPQPSSSAGDPGWGFCLAISDKLKFVGHHNGGGIEMKTRITSRIIVTCLLAFGIAIVVGIKISAWNSSSKAGQKRPPGENRLVVHEWGTFTSIAGKDGIALEWRPLNGLSDLPKFVHTIQKEGDGLRHPPGKAELTAAVR